MNHDERLPGWGVNHDERLSGWGVNHDSYEAEDLGDPDEEGRANALALERDRLVNPDYGELSNRGRSGYRRRGDEVLPVRDDNADARRAARKAADTQGGGAPGRPRDRTLDNVREDEAVAPAPKARPAVTKADAPPPQLQQNLLASARMGPLLLGWHPCPLRQPRPRQAPQPLSWPPVTASPRTLSNG